MIRRLIVLALLAAPSVAHADKASCLVHGTSLTLHHVTVKPAGEEAFELGLREVPATAQVPDRCGGDVTIQVTGAVELTAKATNVWFHLSRDITTPDGLVSAMAGAQVIDLCMRGDRVFGSAVIYADDVLEGEAKRPDVLVRDVELPCDALTLDFTVPAATDAAAASVPTSAPVTEHFWTLRGERERVLLRAKANPKSRSRLLESPSCTGCITLRQIGITKGWVHVASEGEGVAAEGWVRTSELVRIPDDTLVATSYMCTGDHEHSAWGELPSPNVVRRTGSVRVGTVIYASEGSGAWGRFAAATPVTVHITIGSSWAELRHVPGLDGSPVGSPWLSGHVPVDTLTLDPLPTTPTPTP